MSKFVYVLPKYDPTTAKHYQYEYKLLTALAEEHDVRVVIEKGQDMDLEGTYCQRYSFPPFRALELFAVLLLLRVRGYDVTYTHYSYYGGIITGVLSSLLGGRSYYWNCEETEKTVDSDWHTLKGIKSKLRSELPMRLSLRLTDRLVTGTETMVEYYRDHYGLGEDEVVELHNWVDLERFETLPDSTQAREGLGLPADRPIALYLHKLGRKKGTDALPAVIEQTREAVPDVLFVVVGGGSYRSILEDRLERRGVTNAVRFEGSVPNDEAIRYYRAADCYVLPSRAEGFPRVLLEAMAAECAFVSTDVGGIREIVPDEYDQFMVSYGEWDEFTDRVVELLTDDDQRAELAEAGPGHVTRYDRDSVVERFREILL